MQTVIGIDIGGTKIECALVQVADSDFDRYLHQPPADYRQVFTIVSREKVATERLRGYQQLVDKIANLIRDACQKQQIALGELNGIGIGMPGAVNDQMQMVNGNTVVLIGKDLVADLRKSLTGAGKLACSIVCENDANCFVFAEVMGTLGVEFYHDHKVPIAEQVVIGLILGTGLGGGFFQRGRIYRGKYSSALEVGHRLFVKDGAMCYCGRRGCAEQYLAGSALEASFSRRLYSQITDRPDARQIFSLQEQHDPAAIAVINQYRQHLAHLLADLGNIFDPHYIVLGGGISQQDSIYATLQQDLERELFVRDRPPLVKRNKLGDSSGVFGAALLPLLPRKTANANAILHCVE